MTDPVVSSYPGYATPAFVLRRNGSWYVIAMPDRTVVGVIDEHLPAGWSAYSHGTHVGLFPDKQAAGEALVKHAGYEVLG